MALDIYDPEEYEKALAWIKANCPEGFDCNAGKELIRDRDPLQGYPAR